MFDMSFDGEGEQSRMRLMGSFIADIENTTKSS